MFWLGCKGLDQTISSIAQNPFFEIMLMKVHFQSMVADATVWQLSDQIVQRNLTLIDKAIIR